MPNPEISVQLYSVRDQLNADLDGTLGALAEIGFRNVEAFDFPRRVEALRTSFERHGLSAPTAHAILLSSEVQTPDGVLTIPSPEETFEAARALGIQTIFDPFVAVHRWASRDEIAATAAILNERAVQAAAYGLSVGYHNHDHEFRSVIDGQSALEIFAEQLDPAVVLQIDLYWASAAGQDVAALLTRLGDRVVAVHAKDGVMGPGITPAVMPEQLPAGQGDVQIAAALAAAPHLAYAVAEFDNYAGDMLDGVAASYRYLDSLVDAR